MRFYTQQHQYYCGIDLHARTMYNCILDQAGDTVLHKNIKTKPDLFLKIIEPFRDNLVIAAECIFTWYWLADLCAQENIHFVLGHALYMKAIHGAKTKNDRIDSYKIAKLLRAGMIPMAYVYPAKMRSTRDLLRRRMHFMRKRAELRAHIKNTNSQYNLPPIGKNIAYRANRDDVQAQFTDPCVHKSVQVDLDLIGYYDKMGELGSDQVNIPILHFIHSKTIGFRLLYRSFRYRKERYRVTGTPEVRSLLPFSELDGQSQSCPFAF